MADKTVSTMSTMSTMSTNTNVEEDWSTDYEICTNIHVVPHNEENDIKPRIIAYSEIKEKTNVQSNIEKLKNKFSF
jgi:hypothetical protein